jgi:glucosamine--fructose-6-phosphate aminotransferase (isomerizing)
VIASDISAIVRHTRQVIYLHDDDLAVITEAGAEIVSRRNVPVTRERTHVDWEIGDLEKGGCEHFMLKEIREQPEALANTLRGRLLEREGTVQLGGLRWTPADLVRIRRLIIAACGTSCYAGMVGKYLFEDLASLPVSVEQAAEFRYRNPIIEPDTGLVAISQSGETADTLEAVREARRKGADVIGICNVVGSTIARECERGVYLHAGPEIGVASTKAFSCQVAVLAMLAIAFGRARRLSLDQGRALVADLAKAPDLVRAVLAREPAIAAIAERYARADHFFYLGRGAMYPVALEGALKLKEISYIHAEGYHAAELKHGPIALLDARVPVLVLAPDLPGQAKTLGNLQECRARGAPVIAVVTEGDAAVRGLADAVIELPPCPAFLAPIPAAVAEQLFAYHVARARGCPIDQPRNLAKSVTVE